MTRDKEACLRWWGALTHHERAEWLQAARTNTRPWPTARDAWVEFKRAFAPATVKPR